MAAMQRNILLLLGVLLLSGTTAYQFQTLSQDVPCFTGLAELEVQDNDCPPLLAPMAKLSAPFDPATHIPWDCLDRMAVTVEGCMVSAVSLINMSETLFNFSCSWMQLQGNLVNRTHARMAAWLRPSPVARYMLRTTDLEATASDVNSPPKPRGWQDRLEEMIKERSLFVVDPAKPGMVILSQNGRQCNTTFKVVSGGMMGVGSVNRSTLGMVVMPSLRPYSQPFLIRGERNRWWIARARAILIALIVMSCVLGVIFLSALGFLIWRLVKAGRGRKGPLIGSPFEDGVGRLESARDISQGASSLEHHSRRAGGMHAGI
jgi:predicted cobalt transporter CbtA